MNNQYNPLVNAHTTMGRHALKYGFRFQIGQLNSFGAGRAGGLFRMDRRFTQGPDPTRTTLNSGHDFASFLLGTPSSGYVDLNASRALQNTYWATYIQDDWKATGRLTLNVGLRLERESAPTDRFDRGTGGLDFSIASPVEAGAKANYARNPIPELRELNAKGGLEFLNVGGTPRGALDMPSVIWAPRIGAAYRLTNRLVWRGGTGLFYIPNNVNNYRQDGFSLATQMVASLDGGITPFHTLSNPFPNGLTQPPGASGGLLTGVGQSLTAGVSPSSGVPPYLHGLSHQFSSGFQAVLPGDVSLEANYVGNISQRMTLTRRINDYPNEFLALRTRLNARVANPFFGVITNPTSALSQSTTTVQQLLRPFPHFIGVTQAVLPYGRSHYDSLQVQGSKRLRNGMTLGGSYTLAKLLESTSYLNNNDAKPEKVISNSDRPQRLVLYGSYELPFGQGKSLFNSANPVVKRVAGGWQMNWVVTYQSMDPLAFGGAERLSRSSNNPRTVDEWFDVKQFVPQEPFTLRQLSTRVADLRSQGIRRWDFSVLKNTILTERVKMQLRGEFYNFFNTTHFAAPNTSVTNASFGRITGTFLGPREIQVAMRLEF
ncbi:MAG: TonB-dependent receptor [Bryobacteraceae bacterium]|nr:TonB-dependent receptor [Bryobacteraceae bacterium]